MISAQLEGAVHRIGSTGQDAGERAETEASRKPIPAIRHTAFFSDRRVAREGGADPRNMPMAILKDAPGEQRGERGVKETRRPS